MIAGSKVVVTGVIPGHSRETAQEELRAAGAFVQSSVTKETDILVTGARVGATKINKARDLGVLVVTWDELWNGQPASPAPAPVAKAPARRQVGPMLSKAGDLPIGDKWRYEVKWDGYRCVATVKNRGNGLSGVHMASRSDKTDYTIQFPHIASALADLPDCVIDGELVAFESDGTHSFAGMSNGAQPVFMVFDVIEWSGEDLRQQAWSVRREILETIDDAWFDSPLLVLSPVFDDGETLLTEVTNRGLEGVVAKPVDSGYREGSRKEWVKVKVRSEQEFIVVGWTPGKGAKDGAIGALHLGVYDDLDGSLIYVGKVGTGRDLAYWGSIAKQLVDADEAPIDVSSWAPADRREATWVVPELVVQVRFQRWTEDGRLWHPSLQGVREDKPAGEVRRSG